MPGFPFPINIAEHWSATVAHGRSEKETKQSMLFVFLMISALRRNRGEWAACGRGERADTRIGWRDHPPVFLHHLLGIPPQASAAFKEGCPNHGFPLPCSMGNIEALRTGTKAGSHVPCSTKYSQSGLPICSVFIS
ncbi:unnamed protein product [Musa acuminata subsp. malaccensis]|uniref:(wild Malaysian banana) hypothetical protein n=1 Tax=Musa acuminata subsp. malaccensis TaxID=214687 RepID=A0A804K3E3_MUSAM|nr:unnamed protein product [Musa acuminata subsp. malaccensis]